jgi:hypothetical protein
MEEDEEDIAASCYRAMAGEDVVDLNDLVFAGVIC